MADPHAATRELLEERPAVESALESVLAADDSGPWEFDDVDIDSGTFGELVSREIVEREGDEYRVADPEAVRAALEGEPADASRDADGSGGISSAFGGAAGEDGWVGGAVRGWREALHRDLLGGLLAAFLFLFAFRIATIGSVFRDGRVVLPGNDPYHYLYWVERLAEASPDRFAFETIGGVLGGRVNSEPLAYTLGWWTTELLGGGVEDAAAIVAWIPVVAALVVGFGVFLIAVWTTNDERIAVASVVVLALLPGHALYSGIGFFDHHAIDYVWLTLSIVGVTWLARDHETRDPDARLGHLTSPATWLVVAGLAVVFAAMAHSWNGSPILLVGLAVYATLRAASDMRAGWNPLVAATPVVSALGLGFLLAHRLHTSAGWQEPVAVYAPLLVAVGVALVAVAAAVLGRLDAHPVIHLVVSALSVPPIWFGLNRFRPDVADRLAERTVGSLLGREGIAETRSLFAADYGVIFGPIDHFGWFLFVALPVLAWVGARCVRDHEPRWLVVVGYASTLVTFGLVQIRFAGEATGVVAVLSGVGLVYLLSVIDLAERPTPFGDRADRVRLDLRPDGVSGRDVGYAAATVLLVASLSLFMVPAVMDNVAATDAEVEAIEWIDADANATEGPDYVLTEWGRSRMFNYGVNGESNTYGYAQRNYEPLIRDPNPDTHADRFQGRAGYVAIHEIEAADPPPDSGYAQLYEAWGSATPAANGSGRFRLAYVTEEDAIAVFRPVGGATVAGQAAPNATVTVETNVTVPGASFAYERRTTTDAKGSYAVVVAHPGEYAVDVEGGPEETAAGSAVGNRTVTVPGSAISGGERVAAGG
ncbi:hypothetical protein [Halorubrum cibi]|uniref:Dolichyl-diphosphooligosaccharide--protein glycosyltransferase n=1 Tax=Halorubrum cibi TaxID=413815 RepID=A0A521EIL0_9EURY|nr:hypothetical protein [Halorubrum cibi]SMO83736.1 dolichyl-diphosphooligosaccharide--protein glycosyltransferase [Halorubrum cibi]